MCKSCSSELRLVFSWYGRHIIVLFIGSCMMAWHTHTVLFRSSCTCYPLSSHSFPVVETQAFPFCKSQCCSAWLPVVGHLCVECGVWQLFHYGPCPCHPDCSMVLLDLWNPLHLISIHEAQRTRACLSVDRFTVGRMAALFL